VRKRAAVTLASAFAQVPDKDQAWKDLHRLTQDKDNFLRMRATYALESAFGLIPNKDQAWNDLHRLTQDKDRNVRMRATCALEAAFSQVPNRDQAWQDLVSLTKDEYIDVRWKAAEALESTFGQVPNRNLAWQYLIGLTKDESSDVRLRVVAILGSVFKKAPNKDQAWHDLNKLTKDCNRDVRMHAYYSLGRASISKAADADDKATLKNELEAAVDYFEKSSQESQYSPARFCYPFYRTYFTITFKEAKEDEVQRYLVEAKKAVGGSESKDELIKVIENLAGALQESQRLKDRPFQEVANRLNTYRWYCDKAADHMNAARDRAPGAIKLMEKCNPFLEERIETTITEIQKSAKKICLITRGSGTEFEAPGAKINKAAKLLSSRDVLKIQENFSTIAFQLRVLCERLPENTKKLACEAVKGIQTANEFPDKLDKMKLALAYIAPIIEISIPLSEFTNEIQKAKRDIIDHLDQNQRNTVEAVLKTLDDHDHAMQLHDLMKETLDASVNLLTEIKEKGALDQDPDMKKNVENVAKIVGKYNVDLKRKLEVTIPLIPVLLNYKWDIELEGGDINLRAAWDKLKRKLHV